MNEEQKIKLDDMINDFLSKDFTYWIDVSKEYECYENPTLFIENTLTSMGVNGLCLPDGNLAIENTQE